MRRQLGGHITERVEPEHTKTVSNSNSPVIYAKQERIMEEFLYTEVKLEDRMSLYSPLVEEPN